MGTAGREFWGWDSDPKASKAGAKDRTKANYGRGKTKRRDKNATPVMTPDATSKKKASEASPYQTYVSALSRNGRYSSGSGDQYIDAFQKAVAMYNRGQLVPAVQPTRPAARSIAKSSSGTVATAHSWSRGSSTTPSPPSLAPSAPHGGTSLRHVSAARQASGREKLTLTEF